MTKDIKQIQEYNRRKIIKLCNPEFDPERFNYPAYRIDLAKVLLAQDEIEIDRMGGGNIICLSGDNNVSAYWNLTKQTLEEQAEETQRAIFKLLGGE